MFGMIQRFLFRATVSVIRVDGPIYFKSAGNVQRALNKINYNTAKALVVVVNSPGGLPVQSDIICSKIKNFAKEHHLPIFTFAEDFAASGGYFILCIGDKVYVDQSSLVGSVGVIGNWTGLSGWLKRYEVENRKFSVNENSLRNSLDVFSEYNPKGVETVQELLKQQHKEFIDHVENHRNVQLKLKGEERTSQIFNADVFDGNRAVELGLADEIGNYLEVINRLYPGCKVVHIDSKSRFQEIREYFIKYQSSNIITKLISQVMNQTQSRY